ncbi:hypothetical protein KSD_09000 [Ktedonobacter sp. SOSP1-85]|nr:hypothetical protein KSD_09000 [Ktedonobacter sp. SOSP1-85]
MIRAHKIRLNPTPEQTNYLARAAGVARFVWNWALAEWNRQYEAGEKPTAFTKHAAGCPCPFRHGEECDVPLSVAWVEYAVDMLSSAHVLSTGR